MRELTDKQFETAVAYMLMIGLVLASLLVIAGGALLLRDPFHAIPDYAEFHSARLSLRTIPGVWAGALHLDAPSLIQLGLLLLIATPIARVVFCVFGFATQRDKLYTTVSAIVLLILLYSVTSRPGR
jgi:uncharacterized membrane protein